MPWKTLDLRTHQTPAVGQHRKDADGHASGPKLADNAIIAQLHRGFDSLGVQSSRGPARRDFGLVCGEAGVGERSPDTFRHGFCPVGDCSAQCRFDPDFRCCQNRIR